MILLLITKSGVIFPLRIPTPEDPAGYLQQVGMVEWLNGVEARSGDQISVRVSELAAIQLTDETALEGGRILKPQGRIQ